MSKMASINFSQNENKNSIQSISGILQYIDITRYHGTNYYLFSVNEQRRNYIRGQLFAKAKNRNSYSTKIIKDQNHEKQVQAQFANYRNIILNTQKNFGETGRDIERHFAYISNEFSKMLNYTEYNKANLIVLKNSFADYSMLIKKVLASPVSDKTFDDFYKATIAANSATTNNIKLLKELYDKHKGKMMQYVTENTLRDILSKFEQCDIKLVKPFFIEYMGSDIPENERRSLNNMLRMFGDIKKLSDIKKDDLQLITESLEKSDKDKKLSSMIDMEKDSRMRSIFDVCKSIEGPSPDNDKIIGFRKILDNFMEFYNMYHGYFEYVNFEDHVSFGLDYLYFARLFIEQFNYFLMIMTWSLTTKESNSRSEKIRENSRENAAKFDSLVFNNSKLYYSKHLRTDGEKNLEFFKTVMNWDIEGFSTRMEKNIDFEGSNLELCNILNVSRLINEKLKSSCSMLKKKFDMYREKFPAPDEETKLLQQQLFTHLTIHYKTGNFGSMLKLIDGKKSSFYDMLRKFIETADAEKLDTIIYEENERHMIRENIFKINFSNRYDENIENFLSSLFSYGAEDIRKFNFGLHVHGNEVFNSRYEKSQGNFRTDAINISNKIEEELRDKNNNYFSMSLSTAETYFSGYASSVDEKFLRDTYSRYNFKYTNDPFQNVPDIKSMVEIINIDENGVVDEEQIKNVTQFDEIVVSALPKEVKFTEKDFDTTYPGTMYKITQHKETNKDVANGAYFIQDGDKLIFVDTDKGNYGRISFEYNNSTSASYLCKPGAARELIFISNFDFVGPIKQYKILIETTIERKKFTEATPEWKGSRKFSKIYLKPYDNETGSVLNSIPTANTNMNDDLKALLNHSYDYKTRRRGTNYLIAYNDGKPIAFDLKNVYDIQAKTYFGTSKPCYDVYTMNALLSCHNLSKVDVSAGSLLTPEQPKSMHSQYYFMVVNVVKPTEFFYRQPKKYYTLAEKHEIYPYDALICAINLKTRDRYEGLYHTQYYGNKNHPSITKKNQEIRDPIWMIQFDESKLQSVEVHDAIPVSSNNAGDGREAYKTGAFIVYSSPFEHKLDILTSTSLDTDDVMKLLDNEEISYMGYKASLTAEEKEKIMNGYYLYPWVLKKDNKMLSIMYSTPREKENLKNAVDDLLSSAFSTIFSKMATSKSNEISSTEYKKFFDLHQCLDNPYKKFDFLYTKEDTKSDHDFVSNNQKISFTAFVGDNEREFTFGDLPIIGRDKNNKFKITLTFRAKPRFTGSTRKSLLVLGDLPRHDTTFVTEKENFDLYFTRSEISDTDKIMLGKKGEALKIIEKLASNGIVQIDRETKKVGKEIEEKVYEYDLADSNTVNVRIDILDPELRNVYESYLHAIKRVGIDGLKPRSLMERHDKSEYPANPDPALRNYLSSALIRDDFDPSFLGDSDLAILVKNYRDTSNAKLSPINYYMEFEVNKNNFTTGNGRLSLKINSFNYTFSFVQKHKSYVKTSYEKITRSRKENSVDLVDSIFLEKLQKIMPETYSNMIWTLDRFFSSGIIDEKLGDYLDSVRNSIVSDPNLELKRAEILELFNRFKIKTSSSDLVKNMIDMNEIDRCVYTIHRTKINF